ncbi:MAG: TIGR02206 family membrane protein [Saprospiraceae bacterium]|nr:TIGR02206 family membrane protein [Saprospiraceae bacterium]
MDRHATIPTFTQLWWIGLIGSVIAIVFFILLARWIKPENEKRFRYIVAISVLLRELAWHIFLIANDEWMVAESLPLHLCGISRLLGVVLLLKPRQLIFEYLILLGMAGAFQSFITPELTHGYHPLLVLDFYYAHSIIVFMALYAFFVMKMKLDNWSWLRVFVFGHILLTIVGIINYFIDGNYIYLCERPLAQNPLIIGDWPYYLISFQIAALVHIVLFSIIFIKLQKQRT